MILQIKPVLDVATLYLVLAISGSLIMLLIGALAYFYKQATLRDEKSIEGLKVSIESLRLTVASLEKAVLKLEVLWASKDDGCDALHKTVNIRLRDHGIKIDEHEKKIAVLESKLKM